MPRSSIFSSETYRGLAWKVPRGLVAALALLAAGEGATRTLHAMGVTAVVKACRFQGAVFEVLVPGRPSAAFAWLPDSGETTRLSVEDRGVDVINRTNSQGFLERELPAAAEPGTLRVAVLGDSQALCNQVDEEARWPRVLERGLTEGLGKPVQVRNFAVNGTWTADYFAILERFVLDWRPDLVLLHFPSGDLADSVLEGASWERYRGTILHYWTEQGHLEARDRVDKFHYGFRVPALRRSYLLRAVETLLRGENRVCLPREGEPVRSRPTDESACRIVEGWLRRIESLLEARGIPLAIVWYPADSPRGAPLLERFARRHACPAGTTAVDAGEWWRLEHEDPALLIPHDRHLNAEGCRRFAGWLAPRVAEALRTARPSGLPRPR